MADVTQDKVHEFLWVWLSAASYHARSSIKTDTDAERYLMEAWAAFHGGKAAADFGKGWK